MTKKRKTKEHKTLTMRTNIIKYKYLAVVMTFAAAFLVSCNDDPGVENYYTAKGDMANTYLTNRPETFSKFVEILFYFFNSIIVIIYVRSRSIIVCVI